MITVKENYLCVKCHKNERYSYRGHSFQICATCAMHTIIAFLHSIDDDDIEASMLEQETNHISAHSAEERKDE